MLNITLVTAGSTTGLRRFPSRELSLPLTNDEMVFRSFAVVGAGNIGSFVIAELLRLKAIGTVSSVTVVSRSVSVTYLSSSVQSLPWVA